MIAPTRPVVVWVAAGLVAVAALGCVWQAGAAIVTLSRGAYDTPTWIIVVLAAVAALCAVGYLALAFCVWQGMGWPRYTVAVLAAFSLFGLLGGPAILVIVACGVVAAVLLWSGPARRFAAAVALSRAPAPVNPFAAPVSPFAAPPVNNDPPINPWR